MAPLPDNSTSRLFVDYNVDGQAHTLLFRGQAGATLGAIRLVAETFFQQLAPIWYPECNTIGARFSAAGSDFSLPVAFESVAGTVGSPLPAVAAPNFIGFRGRGTSTGRAVNYRVFGTNVQLDETYRVEPPIGLGLDAVRDVLVGATGTLCTIGGDTFVLQEYVNLGVDAYYQRKARSG